MNDRELLELSAKACGMPRPVDDNGVWSAWVGTLESGHWWNPLDDDGDALRLAVSLQSACSCRYAMSALPLEQLIAQALLIRTIRLSILATRRIM